MGIYADHRQGTRGGRGGDIAALDFMRDGEFILIVVWAIRVMFCFVLFTTGDLADSRDGPEDV
ncbi:hypothetical protein N9M16_01180 [Candidatus Dependentiae bacterium]|nr:hypothetical protein [Candidatus Dependentiae bacterium]